MAFSVTLGTLKKHTKSKQNLNNQKGVVSDLKEASFKDVYHLIPIRVP